VLDHRLLEARLRKLDKYVRKLKKYQNLPLESYLADEDIQELWSEISNSQFRCVWI